MSTLKATYLQQASSASPNITLDASTNATVAGTLAMGYSFKRNRIINGDMRVDQRNAGASVTQTTATLYSVDRFSIGGAVTSKFSAQQSSVAPAGFVTSVLCTSLSAYTVGTGEFFTINQRIEGLNISDLNWGTANAKTVTLSFWVRSSLTGTFGGALYSYSGDASYPFSYTISSANTWTAISITIAGPTIGTFPTDNSGSLVVSFSLGANSSVSGTAGSWSSTLYRSATGATSVVGTNGATFYITGVQLETGSIATPYERQIYSDQLAQCQRYYYRMKAEGVASTFCTGFNDSTTGAAGATFFPVQMRIAPTALEQSGTASDYRVRYTGGANTVCSAVPTISAATGTVNTVSTAFTVASGLTAGQGCLMQAATANAYLGWSAEL